MTTKREIREFLQSCNRRVSVCSGNGHTETVYPASWAGHKCSEYTTTSESGDVRLNILVRRAESEYGVSLDIDRPTVKAIVDAVYGALAQ